jgi:hypothetical protein
MSICNENANDSPQQNVFYIYKLFSLTVHYNNEQSTIIKFIFERMRRGNLFRLANYLLKMFTNYVFTIFFSTTYVRIITLHAAIQFEKVRVC